MLYSWIDPKGNVSTPETNPLKSLDQFNGIQCRIIHQNSYIDINCITKFNILKRFSADCALDVAHLWNPSKIVKKYLLSLDTKIQRKAIQSCEKYTFKNHISDEAWNVTHCACMSGSTNRANYQFSSAYYTIHSAISHEMTLQAIKKSENKTHTDDFPLDDDFTLDHVESKVKLEILILTTLIWPKKLIHNWQWFYLGREEKSSLLCAAALRLCKLNALSLNNVEIQYLENHSNIHIPY